MPFGKDFQRFFVPLWVLSLYFEHDAEAENVRAEDAKLDPLVVHWRNDESEEDRILAMREWEESF